MSNQPTRKTILIVDDNPVLTELFDEVLNETFNIRTANSVADALTELSINNIDAVISDHNLGLQNAETLLNWILDKQPNLASKFILITGELRLDPTPYKNISSILYKPVEMGALLSIVQGLFEPTPPVQQL